MSHAPEKIPPALFYGCIALMAFAVVAAFAAPRLAPQAEASPPQNAQSASLRFTDEKNGAIAVYDHQSGKQIQLIASGEGSFIRTAMRAISYERRVEGFGPDTPVELSRANNGSLYLFDPDTKRLITLHAFGNENASRFNDLLNIALGEAS